MPLFGSWRNGYLAVAIRFVLEVAFFYFVSRYLLVSGLDYAVLFGTLLAIAIYGWWKTRPIMISSIICRATRAFAGGRSGSRSWPPRPSAITFLSTPGQAYESGMGFIQNYFGLPFALIVVCAVFIPIYHRLKVVTAYEYLGQRFDKKRAC